MAAAHVSELVTELQTEYDRSRAFLSALEQSLKESRVDDHRREATADGSELGDAAETEVPESTTTCVATAPPKKSSSLLRGKLARFFSRKESKSTSSSKAVVVDPTADNDANVSRVQGLRRASVVALGDHLEDSCVAASGGQSPLAKRSQSFVTRSGNSLAAMPPAPQSAAAMLRATSFRAPAPATISSASQYLLDSSLVPPYPAAATVAVSASQLSLPSVDFRRASLSMARGGGAAGGTGGLSGPGQSSSGCRRRNSVEAMLGQAPLPNGGSFSSAGRRASVELPYAVASGAAASVPVASGTGAAAGAGVTSTGSGCGTNGASLFKKLQQLNLPISECGVPELLSPVASPRATLAGSTLFAPGAAAAATTSQRTQSMQHSPSFQRRSVTSTISSAQHTFVDGAAAHIAPGAMQPTASMDCGADAVPLAQVGTGGSSSGASARRSSLHMPPSAAPSLSALRSQSFRHGGVGGSVSRTSTGPGCGACATTAAAITNQHADVAPEDDDDDKFSGELGGVETAMLERRVASMGPMPGGAATSSLMASLLRRADVAIAASAPPIGSSGGATPNAASGPGMFVGAVDAADVVASGASEADALLSPLPGGGASGASSRHVSGAAAFVPVGALCGSPSSRRLTATQLTPPLLVSPVGHRAATLLQSHNSFGHALSPTPPPAGPLAPQPPHGVLGAAATVDGSSQSPAAGGAVASPSYLSQHRRMSFRASSSTTACGAPGSGFSGSAAFVI